MIVVAGNGKLLSYPRIMGEFQYNSKVNESKISATRHDLAKLSQSEQTGRDQPRGWEAEGRKW
jgi:hypothetical protein